MLSHRTERGDREEEQGADNCDGANEHEPESKSVVTQSSQTERSALLHAEKGGHRDGCDDGNEAAKHDDEACGDIPRNRFGRWTRITIQAVGGAEAVERR